MSAQSVLFDAPGPRARRRYNVIAAISVIAVIAVLALVGKKLKDTGNLEPSLWLPFVQVDTWTNYLLPGIVGTLKATVLSVVLAGLFGIVFGLGRLSHQAFLRHVCGIIVEFFRAVPVLIMMIFLFNVFASVNLFNASMNPMMAVVVGLTLYNGSVIAELVRSGVQSLPAGQREAGLSIGLTLGQTLRMIELPQALAAMLPALVAQLVVVLKDSALGYIVTYQELVTWAKTLGSANANTVPAYLVAGVLFIIMNMAITKFADYLEQRLRRTDRQAGPVTDADETTVVDGVGEPGSSIANAFERGTRTGIYNPKDRAGDPELRRFDPYRDRRLDVPNSRTVPESQGHVQTRGDG